VGVGGLHVDDIKAALLNLTGDRRDGERVHLRAHGDLDPADPRLFCAAGQRRVRLADQFRGDPAPAEPTEQVEELLLPAPPGPLRVDMKNSHGTSVYHSLKPLDYENETTNVHTK
jgi:hypothetical protein